MASKPKSNKKQLILIYMQTASYFVGVGREYFIKLTKSVYQEQETKSTSQPSWNLSLEDRVIIILFFHGGGRNNLGVHADMGGGCGVQCRSAHLSSRRESPLLH